MRKKSFSMLILVVLLMLLIVGCSLLSNRPNIHLAPSTESVLEPIRNEPVEKTPIEEFGEDNNTKGIQWQIELKGDPGVQTNMYTHLPAEEITFMLTFSEEMDRASVEDALQANLMAQDESQGITPPMLKFHWLNPIQLEIVFPGNKVEASLDPISYTISPFGAKNKKGTETLKQQESIRFSIYPSSTMFSVDKTGKMMSSSLKFPFSLQPEGISPTGDDLLLGRWTELGRDGNSVAYLFNVEEKKIKSVFSEGKEIPFWGKDQNLYYLTDHALVQLTEGEEKWIEFAQFPFIHGWSISPDLNKEIFLLSKENNPDQSMISILVKDLETQEEIIYPNLFPMNPHDDYDKGIIRFPIEWIPGTSQVYISSFGKQGVDYLFEIDKGELTEAPDYLQSASWNTPKWSFDGKYITSIDQGIFDSTGKVVMSWEEYSPNSPLFWHPSLPILAFENYTENGKEIIQVNIKTREIISTPGDYRILGWHPNGESLLMIQEK